MEPQFLKAVDRGQLDAMLTHLVRCPEMLQAVAETDALKVTDFDAQAEFAHKLIWSVVQKFWNEHRKLMPQQFLETELRHRLSLSSVHNQPHIQDSVFQLVYTVYNWQDLIPAYAFDILESFLHARRVSHFVVDAVEKYGTSIPKPMWEELKNRDKNITFNSAAEVAPFASMDTMMVGIEPRDPTGVGFIDEFFNGGTRPGELYGFLAPSGGGKTTIANQLAVSIAKRDKLMVFFTYEQSLTTEYFVPVNATATHIARHRWESIGAGQKASEILTPEELIKAQTAVEKIRRNLIYVDMSKASGKKTGSGISDIERKIVEIQHRLGRSVHGIVVDWFWPFATRAYDSLQIEPGKRVDMRIYAQGLINDLKMMSERNKLFTWLPHQLKPDEAKKKRDMEFEDAAELKSFAWYMNGCLCLGRLDEAYYGTLKFSKARNQRVSKRAVQMIGEIATFIAADGDLVYDSRQDRHVQKKDINAVPRGDGQVSRSDYAGKEAGALK